MLTDKPPSDKTLKEQIEQELEWDPQIDASHIGVFVNEGAVTLTGYVPTYSHKLAAVRAAERVYGVNAVADELEVHLLDSSLQRDSELAEAIAHALRWNTLVPDGVDAEVRKGVVTLRGQVEWEFQRQAAERAVRDVRGLKGVTNLIVVKPKAPAVEIERRVAEAIKRSAELDSSSIKVTTDNGTVHLFGKVHSLFEKRVAEEAAAAAPGISKIDNQIVVAP